MLTKSPDFTIYDENIEVVDPKGITLHTLKSYKTSFTFLHMLTKVFYTPEESSLTFRLIYDQARKNIRVSWNAVLIPRSLYGGVRNKLHVDGISVYEIHRGSGLIYQHRVEHLLINDAPVEAPQGIFSAIATQAQAGPDAEGIPVWNVNHSVTAVTPGNLLEFKTKNHYFSSPSTTTTSLFSSTDAPSDNTNGDFQHPLFDQKEFDLKNASRKKFGVKPLTPAEYVQIEEKVKEMEVAQILKQEQIQLVKQQQMEIAKKEAKSNLLGKMFGNILRDTCESNYDCERPEVCCDLGFKKMCCSSGMKVFDMPPALEMIPIKVIADDGKYPKGGPDGDGMNNNFPY